ncbi:hypothetical protein D9M72_636390 [compost metagenome]
MLKVPGRLHGIPCFTPRIKRIRNRSISKQGRVGLRSVSCFTLFCHLHVYRGVSECHGRARKLEIREQPVSCGYIIGGGGFYTGLV